MFGADATRPKNCGTSLLSVRDARAPAEAGTRGGCDWGMRGTQGTVGHVVPKGSPKRGTGT